MTAAHELSGIVQRLDDFVQMRGGLAIARNLILSAAVKGEFRTTADPISTALLGDVVSFQSGYGFKSEWYTDEGVRLLRGQNVAPGALDWSETRFINADRFGEFERFQLEADDIVLALDRPIISTGLKVALVRAEDLPALLLQRVARIKPSTHLLSTDFLWLWLNSPVFRSMLKPGRSNGVPHISTGELAQFKIELPTLKAQEEIIAITNQLLMQVDQLQTVVDNAEVLRASAFGAALSEAESAPSGGLDVALDLIKTAREVTAFERTAFVKAVEGHFTGPEQQEGWRTVTVGEVSSMTNGRAFKPADWRPTGLPIVRIQNLNNILAPFNYAEPEAVDPRYRIDNGDVLLSWSGTPGTSFGVFIWSRGPAALNQHIFHCTLQEGVSARWFQLAVNAAISRVLETAHGGVGLKHLRKGQLEALAFPLPPLNEQQRLISALDRLTSITADLKNVLDT